MKNHRFLYDLFCFAGTQFLMSYLGAGFVLLDAFKVWDFWKATYFTGHIFMFGSIVLLKLLFPAAKKEKRDEGKGGDAAKPTALVTDSKPLSPPTETPQPVVSPASPRGAKPAKVASEPVTAQPVVPAAAVTSPKARPKRSDRAD